jgi:hypothetical protein
LNNFLAVRQIFTISIPIDSSWQGEKSRKFKNVPNFTLGEQQGILVKKNTHKIDLLTNEPYFTNNTPICSARQAQTQKKLQQFFKIRFKGTIGEFS